MLDRSVNGKVKMIKIRDTPEDKIKNLQRTIYFGMLFIGCSFFFISVYNLKTLYLHIESFILLAFLFLLYIIFGKEFLTLCYFVGKDFDESVPKFIERYRQIIIVFLYIGGAFIALLLTNFDLKTLGATILAILLPKVLEIIKKKRNN